MGNQQPTHHGVEDESRIIPVGPELSEEQQKKLVQIFCGPVAIDPAEVEAVVFSGKPGDAVGSNTFFPQNGKSPFLEAARAGKLASVQFMLERYPDAVDINGRGRIEILYTHSSLPLTLVHYHVTALLASCFGGSEEKALEVVKYLISKGALVNVASCYGSTPLIAAAEAGHVKVLRYLIQCGADIHAVCTSGSTALHHAVCGGSVKALKFLIKKGAFVNCPDSRGWCAIHYAAQMGERKVVRALLANGVTTLSSLGHPTDPNYVPAPIVLSASQGYLELVEDLQKHTSRKILADAYLMYGLLFREQWSTACKYFRKAFDLRARCSDSVEYLPPCAAYDYQTEVKTFDQCRLLPPNEQEYQSLIMKERCIGVGHAEIRDDILNLMARQTKLYRYAPCEKSIALLSRIMMCLTTEIDNFPTEYVDHHYCHFTEFCDSLLKKVIGKYSHVSIPDREHINLQFFVDFTTCALEHVKSSVQNVRCGHVCCEEDLSMLTFHGLRLLCFWCWQERVSGRDPVLEGSECNKVGKRFTLAYLYAPNNSTLLCQALSLDLYVTHSWETPCWNFKQDLADDLIPALLHWGADAAVNDPCIVSGQRPLHMAAEHHSHRVVSSLIEAGAHLDAVNRDGQTALDVAIARNDPEVISTLILTSPLPLYCQVSRFIATSGDCGCQDLHIPAKVKEFVALHDKCLK